MKLGMYLVYAAVLAALGLAQGPARNAWGVGATDRIFRYSGTVWTEVPGGILTHVCLAQDGTVWAVTRQGEIFRRTATDWERIPGSLVQIAVASERNVWGVNAGNQIYQWNGNNWTQIPGAAVGITAAADGTVWVLGTDGGIYQRVGDGFQRISGQLAQISAGNALTVWGVTGGNAVYRFVPATGGWDRMPGVLKQVSVAADGEVWGITTLNELVRWDGTAWAPLGQTLTQVTIGSPTTAAPPAGGGRRVEETSPEITYNGTWTPETEARASGGTLTGTSTIGSTATYRFTGDSLVFVRRLAVAGGRAQITIDGNNWGLMRFDWPVQNEDRWANEAILDNLGPGPHTIVVSAAGQSTINNGSTIWIDAFETPARFTPSADQQAALTRLNQIRSTLGLPATRLSAPLSQAAQSHADYITTNNSMGPEEVYGQPGYTGQFATDRANFRGFASDRSKAESIHNRADPTAAIDFWLGAPYRRAQMLAFQLEDMGYGASRLNGRLADDLLLTVGFGAAPPARIISTYPANGQTGVPVAYVEDAIDPMPGVARPLGFALSVHVVPGGPRGNDAYEATGTLTGPNNQDVPVRLINSRNDPTSNLRDLNTVFLIPLQPLLPNTLYQARVVSVDGSNTRYDQQWSFTTGLAAP